MAPIILSSAVSLNQAVEPILSIRGLYNSAVSLEFLTRRQMSILKNTDVSGIQYVSRLYFCPKSGRVK